MSFQKAFSFSTPIGVMSSSFRNMFKPELTFREIFWNNRGVLCKNKTGKCDFVKKNVELGGHVVGIYSISVPVDHQNIQAVDDACILSD